MGSPLLRDGERYELLGEVASGGMATVYLARMRRPMGFSRLVAIKCMHPQFAKDPSFVSMFMDEARLTARLRHPNIVPTLDIVAEDGHLLLVMEYVEGTSLSNLLRAATKSGTRIPVPIACAIIHDVLLGLHAAHQAQDDEGAPLAIVHRDVSPQNVLVGLDGLSRVLDFGVAKARQNTHHSNDNEIKGKIPYMPPEQLFGEAIDHKVDVYAAGVSLWEALVCERLFDGPSETALVKKISEDPIARPGSRVELPPELDAIVMKALSREAKDRFESAQAMAEAIAKVVTLPTRTEVSAWIRPFIVPREVPSGTTLPPAAVNDDPATTMLAILEKASMLRPSSKRPAATAASGASIPAAPARQTRTTRFAIGFAAVAFAVAAAAVAKVAKSEAATPIRTTAAITTVAAPPPGPPKTEESVPTPAPAQPEAKADEPSAPAAKAPAEAAKAPRPTLARAVARPAPAADKVPTPAVAQASCKVPFTIDAAGHKHYKEECM